MNTSKAVIRVEFFSKAALFVGLMLVIGLGAGCDQDRPPMKAAKVEHPHEHIPPHGGTPVVLGDEEFHLEFVLDATAGKLQIFVMDGELENFVRIAAPQIEVIAKVAGQEQKLVFQPVANSATGETVGDTSLFEAKADWLKTTPVFDAVLKAVSVRDKQYSNVAFNFPKGNDADAKK